MSLPGPFQDVVDLDRKLSAPIVQFGDIKARRRAGRHCEVYLKNNDTVLPGGSPSASKAVA